MVDPLVPASRLAEAQQVAYDLAAIMGRLAAVVEWCIENDGETLADNPRQLDYAKRALGQAKDKRKELGVLAHP